MGFRGFQHSSGFTLIEILIAMLIVSGLGLAVATVADMSQRSTRNSAMGAEHVELLSLVRHILSQTPACSANLTGVQLDLNKFAPSPIVLALVDRDPKNPSIVTKGKPLITRNQFGKIQVNSVTVRGYAQLTATTWLVKVGIQSEKTGLFFGGKDLLGEISTQVEVDGASRILRCLGDHDLSLALSNDNNELNDRICEVASNGALKYDPVTKSCMSNDNCFAGTANQSACPSGTRIASCNAEGYIDPNAVIVKRKLRNGKTVSGGAPGHECTVNAVTNSASCEYADDVNSSFAKCMACCRALVPLSGS